MAVSVPKDSRMSLDWLQRACAQNPVSKIMDDKGQFTGNYLTGPVRLSFPNLFKKKAGTQAGARETFNVAVLMPPGQDKTVLDQAVTECAMQAFPDNKTAAGFVWYGLQSPFHDQAEKTLKYEGYTPGAIYFNSSSEFKPRIVDPNMNDIIDEARVYPGEWAMLAVNPYSYNNMKKGVSLGLQSVVIIGDDTNIGGGGQVDPRKAFAGIKLDAATNVAAGFGVPVAGVAVPPAGQESNMDALRRMGLL